MLGDVSGLEKIYIVCGYTDMRKSIDGLCTVIEDQLKMEVRNLSWREFDWLMSGIDIDQPKALKAE